MIAKDVRQFLKRFETTLKVLAREGRYVELDARFDDYQKLLNAWLDVAPPGVSPSERIRLFSIIDTFGGPLEIDARDIAAAAALSGDSSTVVTLAEQLLHSAFACFHKQQPRLMEEFLKPLVFLYYRCIQNKPLAEALGDRLDSGLHSLLSAIRSRLPDMDNDIGETDESDIATLDVVLRFALSLLHAAIRYEQIQHASYFIERIFEHRKYKQRHHDQVDAVKISRSIESLFDYIAVVLVGWSLHILQSNACKDANAADTVFRTAISQLPSIPVLVAEWELLRAGDYLEPAIDARLGIDRWDIRDWNREFRAGVCETRMGGTNWVRLGLNAALLCSTKQFWGDQSKVFAEPPKRFVWNASQEREALEKLAADERLAIPEDKREGRVNAAMSIIESRARGADAKYLRYVLEHSLSDTRITKLRDEACKAYQENLSWQNAFRECGLSEDMPKFSPLRTRWGIWVPREYLLDDNNWASGFGEQLGKETAVREAMAIIHLIETNAPRGPELDALARLPEVVRSARRQLSNDGFNPNVLILPREDRFAGALYGKPLWQVEGRGEFGEASIGVWEQMHVLQFPYSNPEAILLIDTRRTLAKSEINKDRDAVNVWVDENPVNQEIAEKIANAAKALETEDVPLPESSSIQVLARMETLPSLALSETQAVIAIDIRNSDGGYALPSESDLYHRPSCPDIEFEDVEYLLHLPRDSKRNPCPKCKPQQWNVEARRGKVDGE